MRLEIGNSVRCTDGLYGELADIVIDPLEKRVAHLVVRPEQNKGEARLVPIELAKGRDDKEREIELGCTLDEAQGFESVHKSAYLQLGDNPAEDPDWDVGVEDVLALPYYAGGLHEDGFAGSSTATRPSTTTACPRATSRSGGRAASSLRTTSCWARWTASWSTQTST